jgi:hypothetical protein
MARDKFGNVPKSAVELWWFRKGKEAAKLEEKQKEESIKFSEQGIFAVSEYMRNLSSQLHRLARTVYGETTDDKQLAAEARKLIAEYKKGQKNGTK